MEEKKYINLEIMKNYEKSEDYKKYYVTGAIGGFRNPYDFRLSFYNIDSNEFIIKTHNLKDKKYLNEEEFKEEAYKLKMPHILQCEIIMTEQAVRELHNFLGKEIKNLDDMKKSQNK